MSTTNDDDEAMYQINEMDISSSDYSDFEEDDDTASLDHLSEGEDEVSDIRKKKKSVVNRLESRFVSYERNEDDDIPEEEIMSHEHEKYLKELSQALEKDKSMNEEVNSEEEVDPEECNVEKFLRHNPNVHWKVMKPVLGERYASPSQLKECLINYALANGYQIWFERNDHKKLLAKCGKGTAANEPKCPFRLWATWMGNEHSFQVKSLVDEHRCYRNFKFGSLMNYKYIAKTFASRIRENPEIKLPDLQAAVLKKFKCKVSKNQVYREKAYAIHEFENSMKKHYDKLWDYAEKIRRANPGSIVKMKVQVDGEEKTYFEGFYICFQGLKEGWIRGCRRVIGLDGCFLKGICKGELLSAVGRDGNNQIYPIAWAVVTVDNKSNWSWFMELVRDNLSLENGAGVTLISDQHKGLLEVVKDYLPEAEHRSCARHIYANFRKNFSGVQFRNLFWAASKSSYQQQFNEIMQQIKKCSCGCISMVGRQITLFLVKRLL